jgi:phosphoribosylformylglycinamidine synthase
MKAQIFVTLKKTVLDPQGATIARALKAMGHPEIEGVRQGKFFEIDIADGTSKESLAAGLNRIAEDVLANPVIEEFRVEILD